MQPIFKTEMLIYQSKVNFDENLFGNTPKHVWNKNFIFHSGPLSTSLLS